MQAWQNREEQWGFVPTYFWNIMYLSHYNSLLITNRSRLLNNKIGLNIYKLLVIVAQLQCLYQTYSNQCSGRKLQ